MAFATITFPTTIFYFFIHFALKQDKKIRNSIGISNK